MLGQTIAARPLARDGLGRLTSDFGRMRLVEAPLQARRGADTESIEKDGGAKAARAGVAAATRP